MEETLHTRIPESKWNIRAVALVCPHVQLRPYQQDILDRVQEVWAVGGTPLVVAPTGAGKTVIFARALQEHVGEAIAIAHRKELVDQISLALGRERVRHRIIMPRATVRSIIRQHIKELGESWVTPISSIAVAGVDSLRNADTGDVSMYVVDEAHHVLRNNKWGKAILRLPTAARGLHVTATPVRADGRGLGKHADGLATHIVEGPPMRELIDDGHLCDYKIYAPSSGLDLSDVRTTATGEYSGAGLKIALERAKITGDIVTHYKRHASGMRGVTFAVDIDHAHEIAAAYNAAGVPALAVSSETKAGDRERAIEQLKSGEVLQLVNVDLFGEGFDLPAIYCVSFARPTQSYALYAQQFGRALRIMPGKSWAIIIDHVGNVVRHRGPPDFPRVWTLDRREKRSKSDADPMAVTACPACTGVYRRILVACPYCGHVPERAERSAPEHVDGDLVELDAATLDLMRAAVAAVDQDPKEYAGDLRAKGCPSIGVHSNTKRHEVRQAAQSDLRPLIDWWAGIELAGGLSERETMKLFFLTYGVDCVSARALCTADAQDLRARLLKDLPRARS